jgi:hypothetical protein
VVDRYTLDLQFENTKYTTTLSVSKLKSTGDKAYQPITTTKTVCSVGW